MMLKTCKNDPEAIYHLGEKYFQGGLEFRKDMRRAAELWTEAAEHGSIEALYNLGVAYYYGNGVQEDKDTAAKFFKKAAMQGHVLSRYNLGCDEGKKGNYNCAARHFFIAAKMGCTVSLEMIKKMFMEGGATKEQYTDALKGYLEAAEEMKSHDRDEARRWNARK